MFSWLFKDKDLTKRVAQLEDAIAELKQSHASLKVESNRIRQNYSEMARVQQSRLNTKTRGSAYPHSDLDDTVPERAVHALTETLVNSRSHDDDSSRSYSSSGGSSGSDSSSGSGSSND